MSMKNYLQKVVLTAPMWRELPLARSSTLYMYCIYCKEVNARMIHFSKTIHQYPYRAVRTHTKCIQTLGNSSFQLCIQFAEWYLNLKNFFAPNTRHRAAIAVVHKLKNTLEGTPPSLGTTISGSSAHQLYDLLSSPSSSHTVSNKIWLSTRPVRGDKEST